MQVGAGDCWLEWTGTPDRRRVLVFNRWEARFADELAKQPPQEVVLFNVKDWGDFSYLYPYKDSLLTLEVAAADDYSGLVPLKALRRLVLRGAPRRMGSFDLSVFRDLVEVDLCWFAKYPLPLPRWPNLRDCRLYDAPVQSIAEIGGSSTLHSLRLDSCRRLASLDGIQALTNLHELRVGPSAKAIDIAAIGGHKSLRSLRIVSRVAAVNIEALAETRQLERIEIDAEATYSFSLFKSMDQLQSLSVRGDWLDGAASDLLSLPKLKSVAIQPSKERSPDLVERLGLSALAARHGFAMSARGGARGLVVLDRMSKTTD